MAVPFLDNIDAQQHELQNAVAQNLSTAPASPKEGQFWYDTTGGVKTLKFWNGSAWVVADATKSTGIPLGALATIATATLLGNNSGSAAVPSALTAAQAKTLLAISSSDVSGLTAAIEAVRLDQMTAPAADVSWNSKKITNLADPSLSTDAATKQYVDSQAQSAASGIDPKEAVLAASTGNLTLSGAQTVDGVALSVGDRVLVKDQTTASENGIYTVASGAWSRTSDASQGTLTNGALVLSTGGTVNAGTQWYLQTSDPITVGTTALTWTQFGAGGTYTADASGGLQLTGSAFSVKLPAGSGLQVGSSGLNVDKTVVPYKYSQTIGDGASTSITVTHNLNTQDVHVSLRAAASPYDIQYASVQCTDANNITISFATAPASNSLRVTVLG